MTCQHTVTTTETTGHTNSHDEPDYQVTQVTTYCLECGAVVNVEVYDTRN
jgi:hypothetical protein